MMLENRLKVRQMKTSTILNVDRYGQIRWQTKKSLKKIEMDVNFEQLLIKSPTKIHVTWSSVSILMEKIT
jgi:hypothetical protein